MKKAAQLVGIAPNVKVVPHDHLGIVHHANAELETVRHAIAPAVARGVHAKDHQIRLAQLRNDRPLRPKTVK